mgnify:CR=1 FL=1
MIHKFPYYNLMMAEPGEGETGPGQNQGPPTPPGGGGGTPPDGGTFSAARLIVTGIDCGEIVEIGRVDDYFPGGATTIPSTEMYEMAPIFAGGGIGFNHTYFKKLQKQCIQYPGYLLNKFEFLNENVSYQNALNSPLDGTINYSTINSADWEAGVDFRFTDQGMFTSHTAELYLNARYWNTPLQALLQHNRDQGISAYFSTSQLLSNCRTIMSSEDATDSYGNNQVYSRPFEKVSQTAPVVVTKMPLYDFTDGSTIISDFKMYWIAQTWSHIDSGPGLNGNPQNDFRLVTKSGTPINFGTFPGSIFGEWLPSYSYTDTNQNQYQGNNSIALHNAALPYGLPRPIIPFRKTPFSVSFNDCFPDGPDTSVTELGEGQQPPSNPFPFIEELGFRINRGFPYIKQHNVSNDSNGFPNSGFAPGDLPNISMITAHNQTEQNFFDEQGDAPNFEPTENWPNLESFPSSTHQKGVVTWYDWLKKYKEIGINNTTLTINQFFIQDYDFAGVYQYDEKGLPMNHNETTFNQNLTALDTAINHPDITPFKKKQALIMRERYVLTDISSDNWGAHTGPLDVVEQMGVQYDNGIFTMNSDTSLMLAPEDTFSPLGPPAPAGYTPVVGPNCLIYFVPEPDGNPNIEPPPPQGHHPYYFSNQIDINNASDVAILGFNNNYLIDPYRSYLQNQGFDLNDYSMTTINDLFQVSQHYVDRVLWKWLFDTYNRALSAITTSSDNTGPGSEPDPDDFVPSEDSIPNVITLLLQPDGLSTILEDPNNVLNDRRKQNIEVLHRFVNNYNALYEQQISDEGQNGYNHIQQLLAPITREWSYQYGATEQQVSQNLKLNPNLEIDWQVFLDKGWNDWLKLGLVSLPTSQGGLQYFEFYNFTLYLILQGGTFIPNDTYQGTPAGDALPPPETTDIEYGTFYQSSGQTLSPGINNIVYYGPDFSNLNSWIECEYLNQNFDSFNGQIESVRFGTTSALIYTGEKITLPDGSEINGGFYPTEDAELGGYLDLGAPELETVLKTGQNIQVFVRPEQPEFETTAFGSPITSQYGENIFNSGTTLYTMIQTLKSAGYDGQTLDANSDGNITLGDGESLAQAFNDYRPYQMISFAQQINMMDVIYQNFPPEGYVVNPLTDAEMENYDLPPIPDIFVEAAGSVKTFDATQTFTNTRVRGYFKGNPAFGEKTSTTYIQATDGTTTLPNSQGSNPVQNEIGSTFLTGNQVHTQSRNSSNDPYGYVIMDGDPDLTTSEPIFSVSFGHKDGSGSLAKGNGKSAACAVYKQWANTLLGTEEGEFFSISGSLRGSDISPSDNVSNQGPVTFKRADKFIYVLSSLKRGDTFLSVENRPDWKITLSGSDSSGDGVSKSFVSDYEFNPGGTLQSNGLTRYNIIQGTNAKNIASLTSPEKEVFGHFYPEMGVWIFNEVLAKTFSGQDTNAVSLNTSEPGDNGLAMNGGNSSDLEYNNALKFINTLIRNDENKCIENLEYQNEENLIFCVTKIKRGELNYTNNSTRVSSDGTLKSFNSSMNYDEEGNTSPTTFANSIQIYDSNGYMVAVGKLSTPIKKDYNSEVVIKVVIPT